MNDELRRQISDFVSTMRKQRHCFTLRSGATLPVRYIWQSDYFWGDDWRLVGVEGERPFQLQVQCDDGVLVRDLDHYHYGCFQKIVLHELCRVDNQNVPLVRPS